VRKCTEYLKRKIREAEYDGRERVTLVIVTGGFSQSAWIQGALAKLCDELNDHRTKKIRLIFPER
jgi:hypothetical protein